jgi:hypothetical protein
MYHLLEGSVEASPRCKGGEGPAGVSWKSKRDIKHRGQGRMKLSKYKAPRTKTVADAAASDPQGGLRSIFPYINWRPNDRQVTLDARFTAIELREIADFMDAHQQETT